MAKSQSRPSATESAHWERRLASVGRSQSRYLWVLLVLGIFYISLIIPTDHSLSAIPWLGFAIDPRILLGTAPSVLFILIIVFMGTLRAYGAAKAELGLGPGDNKPPTEEEVKTSEAYDEFPNALDMAVFTRRRFQRSPWTLLLLNYPIYLSFFLLEGTYLWLRFILAVGEFPGFGLLAWLLINSVGAVLGPVASVLVVVLWCRRIALILRIFSRD